MNKLALLFCFFPSMIFGQEIIKGTLFNKAEAEIKKFVIRDKHFGESEFNVVLCFNSYYYSYMKYQDYDGVMLYLVETPLPKNDSSFLVTYSYRQ